MKVSARSERPSVKRFSPHIAGMLLSMATACGAGCDGSLGPASKRTIAVSSAPVTPGARDANLAGSRCKGGAGAQCTCRRPEGDVVETSPPDADHKRFEIRLGAVGGSATLDSPTLGHFGAGSDETCFYIDVLPGTTSEMVFTARASTTEGGVGPLLDISEYGPKGPWWYDVLSLRCDGPGGRCNRDAADAWGAEVKTRKRGRIDPCGSTVISHLVWNSSGGTGEREMGLFHDFIVRFSMDVRRFRTQFHPGATECANISPSRGIN